ncbi:MAG TPA: RNA polymerase sigma factor RpoD/SigA [Vicinamibacteria bacterium]|jgi:RNA polymerase primary sigma factor
MPSPSKKKAPSSAPARVRKPRKPPVERASADSLGVYIREIARFKPLSTEDERALGRRIHKGDQEALKRLVEANLRFVVSYAKRYRGLGPSFLDLIHEGTLGLMEAAKRYDPERNVRFISYAVWWVRQAIFQALSEHARVFRVPPKLSGQISKVGAARQKLSVELERQPTTAEVAERTEMSPQEVEKLMEVAGEDLSLSTAVGEDGRQELGDVLPQENIPSVEVALIKSSLDEEIRRMVSELDEKEREVIRLRFGLDGDDEWTLDRIGKKLGLSRERVRQIESRAKEKLRRSNRAHELRGVLN